MRSGRLKNTIEITRRGADAVDDYGTPIDTWAPVASMRAEIVTNDAQAFLREYGETVETAIVFRVRFRDGIEPGDRVTMDGRDFDLVEIKEVVRRRVLELRCAGGKP
jgi:SPP1 family predicted phage head-tail adaptor